MENFLMHVYNKSLK